MSAEIIKIADGVLTVRFADKLSHPQLAAVQCRVAEILREHSKMRILILAENFQGWEKEGDWGDVSFQIESDRYIEKMAIVGEEKWRDLALVFTGQGFRKFPIEFFPPKDLARAQVWLQEKA